ncbi:hypothetical protein E4U21_000906 [Claviceps maximensis]|nr:hypothetical protein E4U21_000906 [Claviceps maximensis]
MAASSPDVTILNALRQIQQSQKQLLASVEMLTERVNAQESIIASQAPAVVDLPDFDASCAMSTSEVIHENSKESKTALESAISAPSSRSNPASRIVLTEESREMHKLTGVKDISEANWDQSDGNELGQSRSSEARSGRSFSITIHYKTSQWFVVNIDTTFGRRPDFTNTEPAAQIGPFLQWGDSRKIVAMDPWGHLTPWIFRDIMEQEQDGKVCINNLGELAVTKFAVEPVWYLPGVAERFGIDEGTLRRSLFEHTGGSFPELITRGDMKVFLPPIGGLTVYCFGDPEKMSDGDARLSLRIHDECNGSDVFGSDICTCRPYLIFGIEEAVKEAQNGGSGVVIYFRKEGRALGEVTKYSEVVYNARKRGEDRASDYFLRTENIAGVKDMRFQALMPDILHWLGIKKIDRMLSMSNMTRSLDRERVELPGDLIPADSRVEIDAKITAGYFTAGTRLTAEELQSVQGRMWEDVFYSPEHYGLAY